MRFSSGHGPGSLGLARGADRPTTLPSRRSLRPAPSGRTAAMSCQGFDDVKRCPAPQRPSISHDGKRAAGGRQVCCPPEPAE